MLAIEGNVSVFKMKNGTPDEDEDRKLAEQESNPELAAQQLIEFAKARQGHAMRHKRKQGG